MSAEKKYWLTELEIVILIWIICKIRYIIEISNKFKIIIVFIDHSVTTVIVRQTYLIITVNINKLNLYLIWASQYLNQFDLNVQH